METREERTRGLMKLRLLINKLHRRLLSASQEPVLEDVGEGETEGGRMVPNDVKRGHFAVVAVKGGQPKRFIVEMDNLSNPAFLRLLEQAKEEYGFQQKGVLAVPCRPEELQNVIGYKRTKRVSTEW
ncbi:hypothetical protein ACOSP7_029709 [Xanthoceras sorbifolium]|uniref:Uncharacterized protein n=1 Tax=Xanthoceras sorbifolium TaxID=99658 RepID=A0ABQ8HAN2_9ROSI|nr:hypothetical protein JRO89_XS12G0025300 [Xanthoceras sorbifolium]